MSQDRRPFVSGVVLAAGSALRMGRAKQLLRLGGRALIRRVVDEAVGTRLDEVVVVTGAYAAEVQEALAGAPVGRACEARVVFNADHAEGIASSLRCGLRACDPRADAAAVLLADQPTVTAALIDLVLAEFVRTRAAFVRPVFRAPAVAAVPGHPVVIARTEWADVERLRGDDGARVLLARARERVRELGIDAPAPADVDTWRDYERVVAAGAP